MNDLWNQLNFYKVGLVEGPDGTKMVLEFILPSESVISDFRSLSVVNLPSFAHYYYNHPLRLFQQYTF